MILTDDECRKVYNEAMELPGRTALVVTRAIIAAYEENLRGNHVSLQMVSGGGAPEGYLGKVTLRIGDQYRDYYTHPQPSAVKVVRGMVEALEGVLDAPKDTASQFWSCSGGVYEAHQCSQAITIGQQWLKEQK